MWKTWSGGPEASPISSPKSGGVGGGAVNAPGGWHPTVLYLIVLLALEMAAVAFLSRRVLR
jgi:hypothetical protein